MTARQRADRLLVVRGLFESRARAQAAIAAGRVTADGAPVRKASDAISSTAAIEAAPEHPYVSRGGVKLAAALDHFQLDVAGRVCLDVGASTGGFTEVLVARGARRVYAIDVGSGQLHASLRGRPEIVGDGKNRHTQTRCRAISRAAGFCHRRCQLHFAETCAAGDRTSAQAARHLGGADQAAIRGAAPRHQERHRARRGNP